MLNNLTYINMKKITTLLSVVFLTALSFSTYAAVNDNTTTNATTYKNFRHWSISGDLGLSQIDGDQSQGTYSLIPESDFKLAGGLQVTYDLNPYLGFFARYDYNPSQGDVSTSSSPYNFGTVDFTNDQQSLTLNVAFNLTNLLYQCRDHRLNLYLEVGYGYMWYENEWENQTTGDEIPEGDLDNAQTLCMPLGARLEYNISQHWGAYLLGRYNLAQEDDLEGITKGNSNDNVSYVGVGVNIKFGNFSNKQHIRNITWCDYIGAKDNSRMDGIEKRLARIQTQIDSIEPIVTENKNRIGDLEDNLKEAVNNMPRPSDIQKAPEQENIKSIYYTSGSSKLDVNSQYVLADVARKLFENPNMTITVYGNCDEVSTEAFNMKLSQKRADSVKNVLLSLIHI